MENEELFQVLKNGVSRDFLLNHIDGDTYGKAMDFISDLETLVENAGGQF